MRQNKLGSAKASPIDVPHAQRREVRTQFGALPWRRKDNRVQVMMITSRGSGRWIIPKGWPMQGQTPAEAAATEAYEEAGVSGKISDQPLGIFSYTKTEITDVGDLPCVVALFPLKVKKKHTSYPEKGERRRKWMSPKKASKLVDEPDLRQILKAFAP